MGAEVIDVHVDGSNLVIGAILVAIALAAIVLAFLWIMGKINRMIERE